MAGYVMPAWWFWGCVGVVMAILLAGTRRNVEASHEMAEAGTHRLFPCLLLDLLVFLFVATVLYAAVKARLAGVV